MNNPDYINEPDAIVATTWDGLGDLVEDLIDSGADVNIQDGTGQTALIAASDQGYFGTVELLLNRGANPNIKDKDGDSALDIARFKDHKEIVKLLVAHGAEGKNGPSSKEQTWDQIYDAFEGANAAKRLFSDIGRKEDHRIKQRMNPPADNGYISDYLIHWTGKQDDQCGADVLSIIGSTCKLKLSYNRIHVFDWYHEIHEKMACFTDVPLSHSIQHCQRYGQFGIAFHKLKLMNVGAQPVFYASHACKRDMDVIFKFLQDQVKNTTIDPILFRALHRHFYIIQRFSDDRADRQRYLLLRTGMASW
jgi:hypothetical protein